MQEQDPKPTTTYENVRVISPEVSFSDMAAASTAPHTAGQPQANVESEWRVPPAGHQYLQTDASAPVIAPAYTAAPPAPPAPAPGAQRAQTAPAAPTAQTAQTVQTATPTPTRMAPPVAADPVPGTTQAPVELVSWREDLQVTASPQERTVGKVRVHKYVKVEDFTGTIPIEYETVQVIREPVSAQEAALLTPADIAELTQEVELHTQEAVVTRRMVPIERVRLQISRVKGEATINDTLRSEHFEVEEPLMPPNLQDAVRRVDAPYDGRIDHNGQGTQGAQFEQANQPEGGKRRFGRRSH